MTVSGKLCKHMSCIHVLHVFNFFYVSEDWSFLRLVYMGVYLQGIMRDETVDNPSARETAEHSVKKN